jgi:hypothetical protein
MIQCGICQSSPIKGIEHTRKQMLKQSWVLDSYSMTPLSKMTSLFAPKAIEILSVVVIWVELRSM